jgi:hypothetical protein
MEIEEFGDLPPRLEDWTYSTVEYLVKKYEFEPGTFDYKQVLNPTGANQNEYVKSIGSTVCSLANTDGGFILFGVQDRRVSVAAPEHRIVGIPVGGDLLKEFGNKIESIQPEVYFEAVPQVLKRPDDPSKGVFVIRVPKSPRRPHMLLTTGVYYRRGDGGSAVAMTHYEVRDQMMYTEDRMKKVTLLRLELMQYMEIAPLVQGQMTWALERFDVSAFKVLLAEVCSLIPFNLLRKALNIPRQATIINRRLEDIHRQRIDGGIVTDIQRDIRVFIDLCDECEKSLEREFGPLGTI